MLLVRGTRGDCEYSLSNQFDANLATILEVPGVEMGGSDAEGKLGERRRGDMVGGGEVVSNGKRMVKIEKQEGV